MHRLFWVALVIVCLSRVVNATDCSIGWCESSAETMARAASGTWLHRCLEKVGPGDRPYCVRKGERTIEMSIEDSIADLSAWLARSSANRDVVWAHDACALSREVHQEVRRLCPDRSIVSDKIIPLLERVRVAIGELPAEAGPRAQLQRFAQNIELRIADVRAYAHGARPASDAPGRGALRSRKSYPSRRRRPAPTRHPTPIDRRAGRRPRRPSAG